MAEKTFHLEVITPDRTAIDEEMASLTLRASDGRMGILSNHAPLISMLAVGRLICRDDQGKERILAIGEGFVEVFHNKVIVLCDFAEFPEEIDFKRAERAKDRAKERLSRRRDVVIDVERAETALRRAIVRLKLGGQG